MRNWLNKSAAKRMIAAMVILTLIFGAYASRVNFSYNFERFFPADNEDFELYQKYKEGSFFSDSRTIVGVELPNGIFDSETLHNLKLATDSLKKTPWANQVMALPDLKYYIETPIGVMGFPYIDGKKPENFKSDSSRIANTESIYRVFVGKNYKSTLVSVFTDFYLSKSATDSLYHSINNVFAHYGFTEIHLGGRLINQSIILDNLKREMGVFVSISFLLVIITLTLVFKSFWGVITPLTIVVGTAVWNVGFMTIFGKEIDVLSSLIPSILFIVGISDVIHIYTKYIDGLRTGLEKDEAIYRAYKQVGMATFITSITTSIGFLSLLFSGIAPIREFGIYMALGVMTAFVLSFTLFPAAIILLPKPKIVLTKKKANAWDKYMTKLFEWVMGHKQLIGITSLVLFVLSILGSSQLKINNYLTEELPQGNKIRDSFEFISDNFSGMRTIDLFATVKDSNKTVLDYDIAKEIDLIDQYLKTEYKVGAIISPAALIKQTNQTHLGGKPSNYRFPSKDDFGDLKTNLKIARQNKFVKSFILSKGKTGRISGNLDDFGGYINIQKNKELLKFAKKNCPNISVKILGMSHFIDTNNVRVSKSLLISLGLAFVLISILMAFLYKSTRIIFIAIIPNVLPLLLIGLIMYLVGIDIKVSTALIFTIAYGLAVDDTIHFLGNLKIELRKGFDMKDAIGNTFRTTGKSIILTTLILFSGFISHAMSDFTSSMVMGILVSSCLVFAVIIDLTLLPILLLWLPKSKPKTNESD
jgi:predicted RND superfamily exporter protein